MPNDLSQIGAALKVVNEYSAEQILSQKRKSDLSDLQMMVDSYGKRQVQTWLDDYTIDGRD